MFYIIPPCGTTHRSRHKPVSPRSTEEPRSSTCKHARGRGRSGRKTTLPHTHKKEKQRRQQAHATNGADFSWRARGEKIGGDAAAQIQSLKASKAKTRRATDPSRVLQQQQRTSRDYFLCHLSNTAAKRSLLSTRPMARNGTPMSNDMYAHFSQEIQYEFRRETKA